MPKAHQPYALSRIGNNCRGQFYRAIPCLCVSYRAKVGGVPWRRAAKMRFKCWSNVTIPTAAFLRQTPKNRVTSAFSGTN